MNYRQVLAVFFICLAAFSPIFFRPVPFGDDSFYFLDSVCNEKDLIGQPIGAFVVFSLLPCNFLAIGLLFFACCFISCLACSYLGSQFDDKFGWLAGIFVFASPLWLLTFWNFENEALGFVFLFVASALFYKAVLRKPSNYWALVLVSLALIGLSLLFWSGGWLFLLAFSLSCAWLAVLVLPFFFFKFWEFVGLVSPRLWAATENLPAFGFLYQGFLLSSLFFLKHGKALIIPVVFFGVFAFINGKFAVFATFFLAVLATKQLSLGETWIMRFLPVFGVIVVVLFTSLMALGLPPNEIEVAAIKEAVFLADGDVVCNDWATGHWVSFFGGIPLYKSGGGGLCVGCKDCVVLSWREFDCPVVFDSDSLKVYDC